MTQEIQDKMTEIMNKGDKAVDYTKKDWKETKTGHKVLLYSDVGMECTIDDNLVKDMQHYIELRKSNINIKPVKKDDSTNYSIVYIIHNGTEAHIASTKSSLLVAAKNAIYGFLMKESSNKLIPFKKIEGLKIKEIGAVIGSVTTEIKKELFRIYVIETKSGLTDMDDKKIKKKAVNDDTKKSSKKIIIEKKSILNSPEKLKLESPKKPVIEAEQIIEEKPKSDSPKKPDIEDKLKLESQKKSVIEAKQIIEEKPLEKKNIKKDIKYASEQRELCEKIIKILEPEGGIILFPSKTSISKQGQILELKEEAKKYFVTGNWSVFKSNANKLGTEWLSLTKSILKNTNYTVRIIKVFDKSKIVDEGYIIGKPINENNK